MTHYDGQLRGASIQTLTGSVLDARKRIRDIVSDEVAFHLDGTVSVGNDAASYRMLSYAGPTARAHGQIAARADIPKAYYDRIRSNHPDLWLHSVDTLFPRKPHLFRAIDRPDYGNDFPILRAVLSDRFDELVDNGDLITTVLETLAGEGLGNNEVEINGDFDSDSGRLRMRVTVEAVAVNALELLGDYRSPFDGRTAAELPLMFAGFEISNDETGGGALSCRPRAVFQVCRNGATRDALESFRMIHLGGKLEAGLVSWSQDTRQKRMAFIASALGDAVRTFASPEYLRAWLNDAMVAKGIQVANPQQAMAQVVKTAQLTDEEANQALLNFMRSSDTSVLGLAQAVTALAQMADESDRQADLERAFWSIVDHAGEFTGV